VKTQQTQTDPTKDGSSLGSIIGHLAGVIASENFPTGERAALKRLTPRLPPPLTFYRFAFRHLPEGWEAQQAEWMAVITGLALMCPGPHRPDRPTGRALAEAGYSEARLERLLAAEGEDLHTLTLRAARFLAAKAESVNWVDLARLLLTKDKGKLEKVRFKFARDYYSHLKEKE
jgi:CRISPR system Cascade subunit CasB